MRKLATTPGMVAAILVLSTLLLAGCKPVTAPGGAAPEAAATEATTEAATPTAEAATPTAGGCTPGAGSIAVLLPESETPRWELDDRRYLEGVLNGAGVSFTIANAQGDPAQQVAQAQKALVEGAKVLILAGVDSDTGAAVIAEARAAGASVIDYDRLTVTGPGADLYVSFDNFAVGKLMAQTLEPLINGLGTPTPRVVQLNGDPGDNNSALVRAGYSSVATPFYSDGRWHLVADQAVPGWNAAEAHAIFSQILAEAGEEGINAVFAANDVLAGADVQVLKAQNKAPVLLSGRDATV
jgi:D-xylose transport system substrate-binding protein